MTASIGSSELLDGEGELEPCIVIPIFDNPGTIRSVVESLTPFGLPCLIVDDGSGAETRAVLDQLAAELSWVDLLRQPANRGKGAALSAGFRRALAKGHTHAVQIDADGQHNAADIPRLLEAARSLPEALVLGRPIFDASAPLARKYGRRLTTLFVWLETLSFDIADGLCGFRCYPLGPVVELLDAQRLEPRMGFDADVAVRLHRKGVPIINLDTPVRYPPDGISHFRYVRDNLHIARTHLKLTLGMLLRLPARLWSRMSGPGMPKSRPGKQPRTQPQAESESGWQTIQESGTAFGIRAVSLVATAFGRPAVRAVMRGAALYYALFQRTARRASKDYLRRMKQPHGFWASYRHIFCFSQCAADRLFLVRGRRQLFETTFTGDEHLRALTDKQRGAILLGAHLGSFEAMGAAGAQQGLVVNMVMYSQNAEKISRVLAQSKAGANARLLEARPGDVGFAMKLRECIKRGELVGILGDRVLGGKSAVVDFLGSPARFPTGVYALASVIRCPVLLTFALFEAPNRYNLFCEPFDDRIVLPRAGRAEALQQYAQRFAHRLEDYCRRAPDNWFNFYDFWASR